jgi:hypothetical protein
VFGRRHFEPATGILHLSIFSRLAWLERFKE